MGKLNVNKIRKDFPILRRKIYGKQIAYLDNAATSQKPKQVIDAVKEYYENYNANVHRSIHKLSGEATEKYEDARKKSASLINADFDEVIFTKNTTEAINLVAYSLLKNLKKGDKIVLTEMEHHSNIVPWQQLASEKGIKVEYVRVDGDGNLDENDAAKKLKGAKIFSLTHISNVLGTVNNAEKLTKMAHENGALVLIDAAQSTPRMKIDVRKINCDFLAFSAHKMLGPTGIGILFGKKQLLERMPPFLFGGDMIREVTFEKATFNELPWKFEAGTPNVSGAIGLSAAIDYLNETGIENIESHERNLTGYGMRKLSEIKNMEIYGPKERAGIISFNVGGIHAHDLATILDREGICIRAGHHCAMPLMSKLKIAGAARASFYLYNTREEIDRLAAGIEKAQKVFRNGS